MKRKEFERIKAAIQPIIEERDYLRDQLGKIQQTAAGAGTPFDPIKYWQQGMIVERGKWYQCYNKDGHIWEAIKSGIPVSDTDREFFDVIGY